MHGAEQGLSPACPLLLTAGRKPQFQDESHPYLVFLSPLRAGFSSCPYLENVPRAPYRRRAGFATIGQRCVSPPHSVGASASVWASLAAQTVKKSVCNAGDSGSVPGLGRSPGEGNGYPLQYSCLENSMDRGAWQATVHRVAKSQKRLSD